MWDPDEMKYIRHYDLYNTTEEAEEARRREVEKGRDEAEMKGFLDTETAMAYLAADGQIALWEVGGLEKLDPISLIPWENRMVVIKSERYREEHGYGLMSGQ